MKLTKFAQATFILENSAGKRLLIDPGTYNFTSDFTVAAFGRVDLLVITHKHADHYHLPAVKVLVEQYAPSVVTNSEVAGMLVAEGVSAQVLATGDSFQAAGFTLIAVEADHVIRGESIINFGLVVASDNQRVYHPSDTRYIEPDLLSSDKALEPDVLCVPISNRGLVMGIDDALYFTNQIRPHTVIPMHYDSPNDVGRVHPEHFLARLQSVAEHLPHLKQVKPRVLDFGETFEI